MQKLITSYLIFFLPFFLEKYEKSLKLARKWIKPHRNWYASFSNKQYYTIRMLYSMFIYNVYYMFLFIIYIWICKYRTGIDIHAVMNLIIIMHKQRRQNRKERERGRSHSGYSNWPNATSRHRTYRLRVIKVLPLYRSKNDVSADCGDIKLKLSTHKLKLIKMAS